MTENKRSNHLIISDIVKRYGRKETVRGVTIEAFGGEIVGLLGPNGAGKTTTFSIVAGFVSPTSGDILLNGKNITKLAPHERARKGLVYLPQEPSVFGKLTVEDNIRAIVQNLSFSKEEGEVIVRQRLEELKLSHLAGQKAHSLSGGERRRLEITRALILKPDFLLLDEPFSGVDPISVSEVIKIMVDLKGRGMGIFVTDHNVRETLRTVDRAYLLFEGKVLVEGNSESLLSNPAAKEKYLGQDFIA